MDEREEEEDDYPVCGFSYDHTPGGIGECRECGALLDYTDAYLEDED